MHGTWADAAVANVPTAKTAAAVANMVRLVIDFFSLLCRIDLRLSSAESMYRHVELHNMCNLKKKPCYFDLRTVHSNEVLVVTKPWPLQAFWPLHALVALLQALWPLQALAPLHGDLGMGGGGEVLTAKMAAAVTNMVRLVMN